MAVETLAWPAPPTLTNETDGGQAYNMGVEFTLDEAAPISGVEWRVPDTLDTPPGGTHAVAVWDKDAGTRLAYREVVPSTPGAVEQFPFDPGDVIAGAPGVTYLAAVYTVRYVFRPASPVGVESPTGLILAGAGRLGAFSGGASVAPIPSDPSSATFYVSPMAGEPDEAGNIDGDGALVMVPLQASGTATLTDPGAGTFSLGSLLFGGSAALDDPGAGAWTLPALQFSGTGGAGVVGTGALMLPALDLLGTAVADGDEPEPDESVIPGSYAAIVAGLKAKLRPLGLRVVDGMTEVVGRRDVVVGPPTFVWEGFCDPDEPTTVTFQVFLIEAFHERAIDRLLAGLPALIRGVQSYRDATITQPVAPGSYPTGSSDLPCYLLTVEMTL